MHDYRLLDAMGRYSTNLRVDRDEDEEIDQAYSLFTGGTEGPITLARLRTIAKELKEDVTDEQLKDMLFEASGGETSVSRQDSPLPHGVSRGNMLYTNKLQGRFRSADEADFRKVNSAEASFHMLSITAL